MRDRRTWRAASAAADVAPGATRSGAGRTAARAARWTLKAAVVALTLAGQAAAQGLADIRAGTEAFREGDFGAAVEAFTEAITSGDLDEDALAITYNNRGVAHGELGQFDQAIADYTRSLELRPDDQTTRRNLRVAHIRRSQQRLAEGAYEAALDDLDRAIELDPEHPLAYQRRAELHAERGDLALALNDYERAAAIAPDDADIMVALEEIRQERNEIGVAEETAAGVEEAADDGEAAVAADTDETADAAEEATGEEAAADAMDEAPTVEARPEDVDTEEAPARESEAGAAEGEPYRAVSAVNFRDGPSNDAERLGTIPEGTEVEVVGEESGWLEVIVPDGRRAYIYQTWLEPVAQ